MKKTIYIFLFFSVSFYMKGQSNAVTNVNRNIATQFSKPAVLAYQKQAEKTIIDFYNYLNLYSETTHDKDLTEEIDASIINLFLNTNIPLKNILQSSDNVITLKQFIVECHQNEKVFKFLACKENKVSDSYFELLYEIEVSENDSTTKHLIQQKVYFFPSEKHFGTTTKNVWQLKLGEML
ncbi:hypothetical protein [Flavobacterium sp. J27]|uniref:hypothetical protein n=1 Tax=Flavobacterium sp. J27 TaxID=2060419 RepID=UPI0010310B82|nr:hypothetical protein [Flavobacterium sp. J27]